MDPKKILVALLVGYILQMMWKIQNMTTNNTGQMVPQWFNATNATVAWIPRAPVRVRSEGPAFEAGAPPAPIATTPPPRGKQQQQPPGSAPMTESVDGWRDGPASAAELDMRALSLAVCYAAQPRTRQSAVAGCRLPLGPV